MEKPIIDQHERIILRHGDSLAASHLKIRIAIARLKQAIGKDLSPLVAWLARIIAKAFAL